MESLSEEIIGELILRAACPPAHLDCKPGVIDLRTLLTLSSVCRLFRDLVRGLWSHRQVRGVVVDFTRDKDLHRLLKRGNTVIRCTCLVTDILKVTKTALVELVIPANYAGKAIDFGVIRRSKSGVPMKCGLDSTPSAILTINCASYSCRSSGDGGFSSPAALLALGMKAKRVDSSIFAEHWRVCLDSSGLTRNQSMLALVTEPDEHAPFRSIRVNRLPAEIRRPIDWLLQGKLIADGGGDFKRYIRETLGIQNSHQDWVKTLKKRLVSIQQEDLDEHTADAILQDIATDDGLGALDECGLAFEIPLEKSLASFGDGRIFGADKEALSCIVLSREKLEEMIFQAGGSCNERFPVADSDLVVMSNWLEDVRKTMNSVITLQNPS